MYRNFIGPERLMRLQIALNNILVLETVGTTKELDNIWADWCEHRSIMNLPFGGSITRRADLIRVWDCHVGEQITEWDGMNQIPVCGNKD